MVEDAAEPRATGAPNWAAAAGLALVVAVGWWLLSAPQPPNRVPVTTTEPTTPTTPDTVGVGPSTTFDATVAPDNPYHVSLPQLVAGGSLLAGRDDLLVVGGLGQPLRVLDVATGQVTEGGRRGAPIGLVEGALVVAVTVAPDLSSVLVVDVSDLDDPDAVEIRLPGTPLGVVPGEEPGTARFEVENEGGNRLVTVDLGTGDVLGVVDTVAALVSSSPDGRYRLEWGDQGELRVYRNADSAPVLVRYNPFTPDPFYQDPAFSPDGEVIAIVGNGVHLMDLSTGTWAAFDLDPTVLSGRAVFVPAEIR